MIININLYALITNLKGILFDNNIFTLIQWISISPNMNDCSKEFPHIELTGNHPFLNYSLLFINCNCLMSGQRNYKKVNKQMKFEFLNKVLRQGIPINDAAQEIGIHYSTAKTIVFFHKHSHKSYRSFKLQSKVSKEPLSRAHYKEIKLQELQKECISIITNQSFLCWSPRKEVKSGNIELTYLRNGQDKDVKRHIVDLESSSLGMNCKENKANDVQNIKKRDENKQFQPFSDFQHIRTQ